MSTSSSAGSTGDSTRTYENASTGVREQLDPNASSTRDRVNSGELREVDAPAAADDTNR